MAFNVALASYLSGATVAQLRNWASQGILMPEVSRNPMLYSFRDVLALRAVARIRSDLSLQKIRKALDVLQEQNLNEHLSHYSLTHDGQSVKFYTPTMVMDVCQHPGQLEGPRLVDLYEEFVNFKGRDVPDLRRPAAGIEVDQNRLGGMPTIAGTRVPYDLIAELAIGEDNLSADEIADIYPAITATDVSHAVSFSTAVDTLAAAA